MKSEKHPELIFNKLKSTVKCKLGGQKVLYISLYWFSCYKRMYTIEKTLNKMQKLENKWIYLPKSKNVS